MIENIDEIVNRFLVTTEIKKKKNFVRYEVLPEKKGEKTVWKTKSVFIKK